MSNLHYSVTRPASRQKRQLKVVLNNISNVEKNVIDYNTAQYNE